MTMMTWRHDKQSIIENHEKWLKWCNEECDAMMKNVYKQWKWRNDDTEANYEHGDNADKYGNDEYYENEEHDDNDNNDKKLRWLWHWRKRLQWWNWWNHETEDKRAMMKKI